MGIVERRLKVAEWFMDELIKRLHDPTEIPPAEVEKAVILTDGFLMKHPGNMDIRIGFMEAMLIALIVFHTGPSNVKGVRDAKH